MSRIAAIRRAFATIVLRPYIRRELPGWGKLYNRFVGDHRADALWEGAGVRWMRGKLHGYEMQLDLSRWSPRKSFFLGRFYDLGTQSVLQALLRDGDTFVDIGANEGMISLLAARLVGAEGKVVAFEPNPAPRAKLEAAIAQNRITNIDLRAMGLSDTAGELELAVPKFNSGEGSFGRLNYDPALMDTVLCPVRVGDNELDGLSPRLVKIDVEGFETNVIRGLSRLIGRARPFIAAEVVASHLDRAGSGPEELVKVIEGHGYRPFAIALGRAKLGHALRLVPTSIGAGYAGDVLWVPIEKLGDPVIKSLSA